MARSNPADDALVVRLIDASCAFGRFTGKWQLTNTANRTVYVYSSFLQGPAAGFSEGATGILAIHTSLTAKIRNVGVYSYPKADFLELAPGHSIGGFLRDQHLCAELREKNHGKLKVTMDVAFGFDLNDLKATSAIAEGTSEHPANPIVDWRTLAYSSPLPLR